MADLFEYNPLVYEENTNKKDIFTSSITQITELNSTAKFQCARRLRTFACHAYSGSRQETAKRPSLIATKKSSIATTLSKPASESVELPIKHYLKWGRRLLLNSQLSIEATATIDDASQSSLASSGDYNERKTRIYDYMRNFLRKTLPLQPSKPSTTDEDLTSDYDEVYMLDSPNPNLTSYGADEEDTDTNSPCTCRSTDDEDFGNFQSKTKQTLQDINHDFLSVITPKNGLHAEHRNVLPGNSYSSYSDEEVSDIGISDCCQLISDKCTKRRGLRKEKPFQKVPKIKLHITHNIELLQPPWFQPHLSSKAANERLWNGSPGDFILRQRRCHFQLSLRLKTKIKHFVIVDCGNGYKFKDGKKQFSTLQFLITHHSVMAEQLPMTLALARPEIGSCGERCFGDFDSFESV